MNKQQLQEVFEKAVSAWEIRDFATFRVYLRILAHREHPFWLNVNTDSDRM